MIPTLNKRFACIVDRKNPLLAGCILSYIQNKGEYTPMFSFPTTDVSNCEVEETDRYYIMVTRANEMNIRISNAIASLKGCDYLILAGLNEHQKSYLKLASDYNTIVIPDIESVEERIGSLSNKEGYLPCKETDICLGTF